MISSIVVRQLDGDSGEADDLCKHASTEFALRISAPGFLLEVEVKELGDV